MGVAVGILLTDVVTDESDGVTATDDISVDSTLGIDMDVTLDGNTVVTVNMSLDDGRLGCVSVGSCVTVIDDGDSDNDTVIDDGGTIIDDDDTITVIVDIVVICNTLDDVGNGKLVLGSGVMVIDAIVINTDELILGKCSTVVTAPLPLPLPLSSALTTSLVGDTLEESVVVFANVGDLKMLETVMVGVIELLVIRFVLVEGVSLTSLAFPIESPKTPIESVVTSKKDITYAYLIVAEAPPPDGNSVLLPFYRKSNPTSKTNNRNFIIALKL